MIDLITGENRERDLPYWIKIANNEDYDWDEVFEPWEATVDWPAASRWKEMVDHLLRPAGAAQLPRLRGLVQELREHHPRREGSRDGR